MARKKSAPDAVLSIRIRGDLAAQLKKTAGAVSPWCAAVLEDAVRRGVMVTTSGAVIHPDAGDLFAGKGGKR